MEITKETTVTLTVSDLEKILIDHFKQKGIDIKSIYFDINAHHDETDWRSEFPPSYMLDEVVCKGTEEK